MPTPIRTDTVYSDFRNDMAVHPLRGDLLLVTNEVSIQQSLRNLLLTNRYERPFRIDVGSNVRQLLFEPATPQTAANLRRAIIETIENHEPRVNLIDIIVTPSPDTNTYSITVVFNLINSEDPQSFDILLERVR